MGDNWIPEGNTGNKDQDWQDFYHSEFRGFNQVYMTSPSGDLTVSTYASTEGWFTFQGNSGNYTSGNLYEEDVYSGNSTSGPLLRKTVNTYAGNSGTKETCNGNYSGVYTPCEIMLLRSRVTQYEGSNNSNPPWVQHDYTYDDYSSSTGLIFGYHNTLQEVISSSNAPTLTKKWTYAVTDKSVNNWVYYDVHKVAHSEVDDSTGHVWQCQDTSYDEGTSAGATPAAGWPTTTKTYSDCSNPGGTAITSYTGYDTNANVVASVDGVGAANKSLYGSSGTSGKNGCTLSTAPLAMSLAWGVGNYTSCTEYDSTSGLPTSVTNAFGQQQATTYDNTQGAVPVQATDVNNQQTSTIYSYDNNGNRTVSIKKPGETGSYTTRSTIISNCSNNQNLPCLEVDSNSSQYSSAVTETFYDGLGRAVETRAPGPNGSVDLVSFTVYNDQQHSTFQSLSFEVAHGSGWIDPTSAKDINGNAPGGSVTYMDAMNRVIAVKDPLFGFSQEPGISCPSLNNSLATSCTVYGLGSVSGDSATYASTTSIDPNNHVSMSFADALGRILYEQYFSGVNGGTLKVNQQKTVQYNALNLPTSVTVTDLAPQPGQSTTSVTTTATYDDMGRMTSMNDPDKGNHTYTYDADNNVVADVSGSL